MFFRRRKPVNSDLAVTRIEHSCLQSMLENINCAPLHFLISVSNSAHELLSNALCSDVNEGLEKEQSVTFIIDAADGQLNLFKRVTFRSPC